VTAAPSPLRPAGPAPQADAALQYEVEQLLFTEARLLDTGRFEEWLDLYTPDAVYWVPSQPEQTDPIETVSIVYEDVGLLRLRVQRLGHPRAYALSPRPRTVHQVGNVTIESIDGDSLAAASTLIMAQYRDTQRTVFAAAVSHRLERRDGSLRIASKRVDLIDCDGAHGVMSIPF
jgi:benzoate/toluate 1,2-dioxygenase beta subunit